MTFAVGSLVRAAAASGSSCPSRPTTFSWSARSAAPTTRSPASTCRSRPSRPRRSRSRTRSATSATTARRAAPRGAPPLDPGQRRPVPLVRPHRRRAAALPARAAADGAASGPHPAADRRRRRHRQDGRGSPDRPGAARPGRDHEDRGALPAAPRRAVAGRDAGEVPHRRRARPGRHRGRLERSLKLGVGESLFDRLEATVVSMDFIKSDRRRDEFLRAARSS